MDRADHGADADRLRDYWDRLVRGEPVAPDPLDQGSADVVRQLHALYRPPAPDPTFLARLEEQLMPTAALTPRQFRPRRSAQMAAPRAPPAAGCRACVARRSAVAGRWPSSQRRRCSYLPSAASTSRSFLGNCREEASRSSFPRSPRTPSSSSGRPRAVPASATPSASRSTRRAISGFPTRKQPLPDLRAGRHLPRDLGHAGQVARASSTSSTPQLAADTVRRPRSTPRATCMSPTPATAGSRSSAPTVRSSRPGGVRDRGTGSSWR